MKAYRELPSNFKEIFSVDLQKDKKKALLINGAATIIMLLMGVSMHFYIPITSLFDFSDGLVVYILRISTLMVSYVTYIILHEAVHGVAMKICGTKKCKFGFTGLYAYAGSDDYYDKKGYLFIAMAPVVFWGIILAILNVVVPTSWFWVVYFVQIGNISGAAGDLYVTYKFSKLPNDILVHDSGVGMKVYSAEEYGV